MHLPQIWLNHLKYVSIGIFTWLLNLMLTYRNVCCSSVCVECGNWTIALSMQDRYRQWCGYLLLKYSAIFGHGYKSIINRSSVCPPNNNKMCFCKIMKANRMHFRLSQSLWTWTSKHSVYLPYRHEKYIYWEWNVYTQINQFKWKTDILRFCNPYETCTHELLRRWRVRVADFIP